MASADAADVDVERLAARVQDHLARGDTEVAMREAEEALAGAKAAADKIGESVVEDLIAGIHAAAGRHDDAVDAARRAVAAARDGGGVVRAAGHCLETLCGALSAAGRAEEGLREATEMREECRRSGDSAAAAAAYLAACFMLHDLSRVEEALAAAREAEELFGLADRPLDRARALAAVAEIRLATGEGYEIARRAAQRSRRLFAQAGAAEELSALRMQVAECQAQVYALMEQPVHIFTANAWAAALAAAQRAEERARDLHDLRSAGVALCLATQAHVATEKHQAAVRTAAVAAELYREYGTPQDTARALLLGAEAALGLGRKKDAKRLASEARSLAKEAGETGLQSLASDALERVANLGPEIVEGEGKAPPVEASEAGEDDFEAPQALGVLLDQVLGLDSFFDPVEATPLMIPGALGPVKPLSTEALLSVCHRQRHRQARATLALMRLFDEDTKSCRPDVVPAEFLGAAPGLRVPTEAAAAWVAPVRRRADGPAARWRPPPVAEQGGVRFSALSRRRA